MFVIQCHSGYTVDQYSAQSFDIHLRSRQEINYREFVTLYKARVFVFCCNCLTEVFIQSEPKVLVHQHIKHFRYHIYRVCLQTCGGQFQHLASL